MNIPYEERENIAGKAFMIRSSLAHAMEGNAAELREIVKLECHHTEEYSCMEFFWQYPNDKNETLYHSTYLVTDNREIACDENKETPAEPEESLDPLFPDHWVHPQACINFYRENHMTGLSMNEMKERLEMEEGMER